MVFFLPAHGETGKKQIEVTYRNIGIQVNGKEIESEQEPFLFQDRVYAPLRTIAEAVDKEVTWDNENSKVLIEDFPTDSKSDSDTFCFPIHMIEERVEQYPFSITVKKVFVSQYPFSATGKKIFVDQKQEETSKQNAICINVEVENSSDHEFFFGHGEPFTLWDKKGNKIDRLYGKSSLIFPAYAKITKELYYQLTENIQGLWENNNLVLVFSPTVVEDPDFSGILNVFMIFDLGVVVKE
jgi:hypothetical protein